MQFTRRRFAVVTTLSVGFAIAGSMLHRETGRPSEVRLCRENQKRVLGAVLAMEVDFWLYPSQLGSELLPSMVEGRGFLAGYSYLRRLPLEANGDPDSWRNYSFVEEERAEYVTCRIHGRLVEASTREQDLPAQVVVRDYLSLDGRFTPEGFRLQPSATGISLKELAERLEDSDPIVRRMAGAGLRKVGNPAALPALRRALGDPDEIIRKQAVWGIGSMGGKGDAPILEPLLKDPSERVRDSAAFA